MLRANMHGQTCLSIPAVSIAELGIVPEVMRERHAVHAAHASGMLPSAPGPLPSKTQKLSGHSRLQRPASHPYRCCACPGARRCAYGFKHTALDKHDRNLGQVASPAPAPTFEASCSGIFHNKGRGAVVVAWTSLPLSVGLKCLASWR